MSKPDKVLNLIGLAMKAGKLVSGETATEHAVKDLTAWLVIVASDASHNTTKHFTDMCNYRDLPIVYYGTREELGRAIGKDYRSNMAIIDEGLAQAITKAIDTRVGGVE